MFWTNLNQIKFVLCFCVCAPVSFLCFLFMCANVSIQDVSYERRQQQRKRACNWCWWSLTKAKEDSINNRSFWSWQVQILCGISNLCELFSRGSVVGWKGRWLAISPWHQHSQMVCHKGLELYSLQSWWCIQELGKRVLCQCHSWRRGTQIPVVSQWHPSTWLTFYTSIGQYSLNHRYMMNWI